MSVNKRNNRLINEKSPYLLQHAYNPVNWYSWCDEAFEKAKNEDKPIFLSIGYSTCHWCHVMERESFEDEEIADILNENFISIKVDREERPDIDSVYMDVCQKLTGSGGWPLSIFMTPRQRPFYAGTYFPKESMYQRVGLKDILNNIIRLWSTNKQELINKSNEIVEHVNLTNEETEVNIDQTTIDLAIHELMENFDLRYGGFNEPPKFPTPHNLFFLFKRYIAYHDEHALNMCTKTLDGMYKGGMYDHIGGGFSRYSTDREWLVPHFEKMLYDNALLIMAYTQGYMYTQEEHYKNIVEDIINYLTRDMLDDNGGFYSAEDADSEGEEGKFYVFTKEEIIDVLGRDKGERFCRIYNITEEGNFENKNILNLIDKDLSSLSENAELIKECKQKIFDYRNKRIRPHKDDKILTSWNGLIIAALANAGRYLDNNQYIQYAIKAADFIIDKLMKPDGGLYIRYRDGQSMNEGILNDYAFMIWGLIQLYESTFNISYLKTAITLNEYMINNFWDNKSGGFYLNSIESEKLILRPKEIYDGAIPSGNSVAAYCLVKLSRLTGDLSYEEKANKIIKVFSNKIKSYPRYYTFLLLVIMENTKSGKDIVICGNKDDLEIKLFIKEINKHFNSYFTILMNDGSEEIIEFNSNMKDKIKINDKNTVYICENNTCKAPITNLVEAKNKLLEDNSSVFDSI
ncbi:thioredoxin domain-containing protein [Vallitalea longa]|uniref:Thioredoxin domain-containing protein n=1 Tax=Vallitalea longa TaxID=2936439 RepID=A0A9W5Y8K2_9FIRM|nr:thioredoxin domain-containing protein [Vallitalea longa]GKX28812.1 thioredoxin domain-containing protein [Vallitalea longa]